MEHTLIYGEAATGKTLAARAIIDEYLRTHQNGSLLIFDYKAVDYLDYEKNKALFRPICSDTQEGWFVHFLEDAINEAKEILVVMDLMTSHLINKEKETIIKLMSKSNIKFVMVIYEKDKIDQQIMVNFKKIINKTRINRRK